MERTDALRQTLESLARVYEGDSGVPVQLGKPSRAVPEGEKAEDGYVREDTVVVSPNVREELGRNISGPQELRCIANTLSHEIEHIRESDLTSKEDFMSEYPDHEQFAGMVINVLEDQYIDQRRVRRFPGLKKAQAFVIDTMMQNHHRWPRVDNLDGRVEAMFEGFRQLAFAGGVKGGSNLDGDLLEFFARTRPLVDECRHEGDQQARVEIAHECMDIALEYLPDGQDVDMPDECAVCGDGEPVVIAPLLGPVCEDCAPGGHGTQDGSGAGGRPDEDEQDGGEQDGGDVGGDEAGGDGEGGDDGDGGGEPGEDGDGGDDGGAGDDGDGGAGAPGEQSPISEGDGDREIDPTEWDWLDLDGHEDHTVSIVDDDAEV